MLINPIIILLAMQTQRDKVRDVEVESARVETFIAGGEFWSLSL